RRPDWSSVCEPLGCSDDIGLDAPVFDAEPAPGAAEPRLYLVTDKDSPVSANDLSYDSKVLSRGGDESTHPLYRFRDKGGQTAARGRADQLLQIARADQIAIGIGLLERATIAVGVVRVDDPALPGAADPPRVVGGQAHRERGASGIAVAERDD